MESRKNPPYLHDTVSLIKVLTVFSLQILHLTCEVRHNHSKRSIVIFQPLAQDLGLLLASVGEFHIQPVS